MLGNLIAAGTTLLGGILGQRSQQKMADQNIALQKEFAQSGIQWKVADARKAGIHPIYALGANTHSYSPVALGDSLTPAIHNAGQDISRAVNSTSDQATRLNSFQLASQNLTLEKMGLENQLLASQIARLNQTTSPAMPTATQRYLLDGQGQTPLLNGSPSGVPGITVDPQPMQVVRRPPGQMWSEPAAVPDLGFAQTATGFAPILSRGAQERLEDNIIGQLAWSLRNQVMPTLMMNYSPPHSARPNHYWWYNPVMQQYEHVRDSDAGRWRTIPRLR